MSAWPRPLDLLTSQHNMTSATRLCWHHSEPSSGLTSIITERLHRGTQTATQGKLPLPPPDFPSFISTIPPQTTKTKARRRTAGKATGRVVSRVRVLPLVGVRFGPELGTGPASEWDGSDVTNKLAASWCCLQSSHGNRRRESFSTRKMDGEIRREFENVGLWMKN